MIWWIETILPSSRSLITKFVQLHILQFVQYNTPTTGRQYALDMQHVWQKKQIMELRVPKIQGADQLSNCQLLRRTLFHGVGPAAGLVHCILSKRVQNLSRLDLLTSSRERQTNRQTSRLLSFRRRRLSRCLPTLSPKDGGGSSFETSHCFE